MALSNYTPKAVIDAGTPADKILAMMTDLLDGSPPSIQVGAGALRVTAVRSARWPVQVGVRWETGRRMWDLRWGREEGGGASAFWSSGTDC